MKACKHYGKNVLISMSYGYPWNAIIETYSDNGQLLRRDIAVGGMREFLIHLEKSDVCRLEIGTPLSEVKESLHMIDQEWNSAWSE